MSLPHYFLLQRVVGCSPRYLGIGIMTRNQQHSKKKSGGNQIPVLGLKKKKRQTV